MKLSNLLMLVVAICSYSALQCQTYTFETYNSEEGVNPFVYNLVQDKNGFLLVGTGDGLLKFDGLDFEVIDETKGLGGSIISCSFVDSKSRVWLGHSKTGRVSVIENDEISVIDISEHVKNKVVGITEDSAKNIWIASQNEGVICYSPSGEIKAFKKEISDYLILTIHHLGDNNLAIGTNEGVFVIQESATTPKFTFLDEGPYTKVFDFEKIGSEHILCTEDDGLYKVYFDNDNFNIEQIMDEFELSSMKMTDLELNASGDAVYISGGDKLLEAKLEPGSFQINSIDNMNVGNPMGSSNLRSSFVDREDNLWIASFGDGLFKMDASYFTFYNLPEAKEVLGLSICDEYIMCTTKGKIVCFSSEKGVNDKIIFDQNNGLPNDSLQCIYRGLDGGKWLGSRTKGLFYKETESDQFEPFFLSDDTNSKMINCIEASDKKVYVGTSYGLFIIDKESREFEWLNSETLGHNVVKDLFKDDQGKIWLSSLGQELVYFENDQINSRQISENKGMLIETIGITQDLEGNIWIATGTQGVVKLGENNTQYTKKSGLFSSSTYGIVCDKKGKVWVTHRDGLSKIDPETNGVEVFNYKNGIDQDFSNAITIDKEQNIWFGSNDGLIKYNPDLDKINEKEPEVVFTKILLSDSLKSSTADLNLDYGEYKIDIDFIGVSLEGASDVSYQYYLEGYDDDWGELTYSTNVTFKPSPGEYTFKVKAYNSDGIGGEKITELKFSIDNPFWLKPWFIVTALVFVLALVRGVIYWREKQLRARQEYLEAELEARTEEVVNKNHELEERNKDITDSINYAKHIQSALIPSEEELKKCFPESFVFFRPRDIVSGDFYWVKEFGSKIIIVGADCTGHGVPGAFISLIGMSVLKEISNRDDVDGPDKALNCLEIEIENTLNKNKSYGVKDGMDLGVIEYDRSTRLVRYSGARRPLIIFRGRESFSLNGDRQSIGGSYEGEALKKFSIQEFQMEKGDRMYLWSDGYPDQFGGVRAKKLKNKGVMEILTNMQDKSMADQLGVVRESFLTWKNGYEQIDDVLLLGIEAV